MKISWSSTNSCHNCVKDVMSCLPASCYLRTKHVWEHASSQIIYISSVCGPQGTWADQTNYTYIIIKCCPTWSYCACSCNWIADIKYCHRSSKSCWVQDVCGLHNTYLYIPCYGFRNFVLEIWEFNSCSEGLHPAPRDSLPCTKVATIRFSGISLPSTGQ